MDVLGKGQCNKEHGTTIKLNKNSKFKAISIYTETTDYITPYFGPIGTVTMVRICTIKLKYL